MKIWNFGIVGTGLIANFHAKAINDLPNAKLVAACDIDFDRARVFAAKYNCVPYGGYEQLLQNKSIDIVTIATPSGLHMEPTVAAAHAGKHVLCEKPIEITLDRIDAMIEAHKNAGTVLGCILQNRFTEAMVPLKKAIVESRFGVITYAGVYVPWWRTNEYYESGWRGTWKLDGGGALMNQSIHMVDMLVDLMLPVKAVQAFMGTIAHQQIETEDTAVAVLRFSNKALGVIYGTTGSFPGQFKRFEITGTKGTAVYLEDSFTVWQFAEERDEDRLIRQQFNQKKGLGGVADPANISHEGHKKIFFAFLDAMENGHKFMLDGYEGRKAVEIILAIYKAATENSCVYINQ